MRSSPDTARWLEAVDRHLDRDVAIGTWIHYCTELRWIRLRGCDHNQAVSVISKLLDRYPDIKSSSEGCRLIAMVSDLLPPELIQNFLDDLESSERFVDRQSFGELLALISLQKKGHEWTRPRLEQLLGQFVNDTSGNEAAATGIAFAAAHLWDDPESRTESTLVLCRLIPLATPKVATAIGTLFFVTEDFTADAHTDRLLEAVAANSAVLSGKSVSDLIEHLAGLLPHSLRNVLNVCRAIVDRRVQNLHRFRMPCSYLVRTL